MFSLKNLLNIIDYTLYVIRYTLHTIFLMVDRTFSGNDFYLL